MTSVNLNHSNDYTVRIPGVNDNENPEDLVQVAQEGDARLFSERMGINQNEVDESDIETDRLAKVMISHEMMRVLLELPEDVKITSMHTTRGEEETGVYMICNRFDRVIPGAVAVDLSIEDVKSKGLWDSEGN